MQHNIMVDKLRYTVFSISYSSIFFLVKQSIWTKKEKKEFQSLKGEETAVVKCFHSDPGLARQLDRQRSSLQVIADYPNTLLAVIDQTACFKVSLHQECLGGSIC